MSQKSNVLRIKVQISNVVASKEAHYFVLVQFKEQFAQKNIKFRTETAQFTNRPNFDKNRFTFSIADLTYTIKFGLMIAKTQLDADATNAMVFGVASIPITKVGLKDAKGTYSTTLSFVERGKEVGKFAVKISMADEEYRLNEDGVLFDPFISRILYNEQCTDQARLQQNIKLLQEKLQKLYEQLIFSKKEESFFEKLYYNLEQDEKQLRTEIDSLQKINSKIQHKLESLENVENLKIEIDMLSQSEEGKKVMIQRLQYFQDRIYREIEENQKLTIEYKKIKPEIQNNLKKAEDHAAKLKGRQMQQFELENNDKILESYDNLFYQFQVNQQTIKSLSKMSQRSDLTAQQAKLLLSQVNYEIKLAEMGVESGKNAQQKQLLRNIEKEIEEGERKQTTISEEEEMVYKIKLAALQREIDEVRKKLNKFQY